MAGDLIDWLTLAALPGVGCGMIHRLVSVFVTPAGALSAGRAVTGVKGSGRQTARVFIDQAALDRARRWAGQEWKRATAAGGHVLNIIDYTHSFDDLAKDGITPASRGRRSVVEKTIFIRNIDEELCGGGVRVVGSCHGNSAFQVFQPVVGFIFDGRTSGFFLEILSEAATLHHETIDDTMKNGAVIKTFPYIIEKVFHALGRFFTIQFQHDVTKGGGDAHTRVLVVGTGLGEGKTNKAQSRVSRIRAFIIGCFLWSDREKIIGGQ